MSMRTCNATVCWRRESPTSTSRQRAEADGWEVVEENGEQVEHDGKDDIKLSEMEVLQPGAG